MKPDRYEVTVVGSINVDLVATVKELPRPGETVSAVSFTQFPGGKGSNQAVATARLGRAVTFVGLVGDDPDADAVRQALEHEGIDTTHLQVATGAATGRAIVLVDESAENSIVVIPGANGMLTPAHIKEAAYAIDQAAVVVAQLEIPLETVTAVARISRGLFILNPAPAQWLPPELLELVDVLVVNEVEYEAVTGRTAPQQFERLSAELASDPQLPPALVITVGVRGAFVWSSNTLTAVPAPKVSVVDTTGAGDTFIGGLADALSRGEPLVQAAQWAVYAGAISVGQLGATTGMPTPADIRLLIESGAPNELKGPP